MRSIRSANPNTNMANSRTANARNNGGASSERYASLPNGHNAVTTQLHLPNELVMLLEYAVGTHSPRGPDNDHIDWAKTGRDIEKVRNLLVDAASFESQESQPQHKRPAWPLDSDVESLEHSSIHLEAHGQRVAMKIRRAYGKGQRLREFRSRICMIPETLVGVQQAVIAEVCQMASPYGLISLPPTIAYSPVLQPDAQLFRLIDLDDAHGVQRLLRSGDASIRACDKFGRGVLHRAAWNASADLWAMLIAEGADLNSVTALSSSALWICAGVDYLKKIRLALEAGADPTLLPTGQFYLAKMSVDAVRTIWRTSSDYLDLQLRNPQGRTLLLVTAATTSNKHQAEILGLLLAAGAAIEDVDSEGNTCLHILLTALRPGQSHGVEALAVLLQAGADSSVLNATGQSALDTACSDNVEFGSFRRDAFARALFIVGKRIGDDRLLLAPVHTQAYTRMSLPAADSSVAPSRRFSVRTQMLEKLTECVDCQSVFTGDKLHEIAVDRVLAERGHNDARNIGQLFTRALFYLRAMIEGKRQVVTMTKERLPYQSWIPYAHSLDWFQINEDAELAALVDFDWSLPVDPEDLFASHVDNLIQGIEDVKHVQPDNTNLDNLIELLPSALPSYQEISGRKVGAAKIHEIGPRASIVPELPAIVTDFDSLEVTKTRRDSLSPENTYRSLSIVHTPMRFYNTDKRDEDDSQRDKRDHGADKQGPPTDAYDMQACLVAGKASRQSRRRTKIARVAR